jgi:hypothetical protein
MGFRRLRLFIPASFAVVMLLHVSCKKTEPAEALVYVIDSLGNPVAGATVVLRNDSVNSPTTGAKAMIYQEDVTDIAGQAYFIFDLEAVLFVEVTKGAFFERDYIRLEQSKQVEKTIVLK